MSNGPSTSKKKPQSILKNKKKDGQQLKVELIGLPEGCNIEELTNLVNTQLKLSSNSIDLTVFGIPVAHISFSDENKRKNAISCLNGYEWKSTKITAVSSAVDEPPLQPNVDYLIVRKKALSLTPEVLAERAIIPLKTQPFTIRYNEKQKAVLSTFRQLAEYIQTNNEALTKLFEWQKSERNGEVLEVDQLLPSASMKGYCNIAEFDIGLSDDTSKPIVGFRIYRGMNKPLVMSPITNLSNFDEKIKTTAKIMESFLATSPFPCFDPIFRTGVWRKFYVRSSNNYDLMLIASICVKELSSEQIQKLKQEYRDFFTQGAGKKVFPTAIYVETVQFKKGELVKEYESLSGKTFTKEKFLTFSLQTSVGVYIQPNRSAYETLCSKIVDYVDVSNSSQIIDLYCGSGAIGLSLAKKVFQVVGVDSMESAVEDAKENAKEIDASNCVYLHGKAEDLIDGMIRMGKNKKSVAIVHPPCGKIEKYVLETLKKNKCVEQIVYVSEDPQSEYSNFSLLGSCNNADKSDCFLPLRTGIVDVTPESPKYTFVTLFERYNAARFESLISGNPKPKDQAYVQRLSSAAENAAAASAKAAEDKNNNKNQRKKSSKVVQKVNNNDGKKKMYESGWVSYAMSTKKNPYSTDEEQKEYRRGYIAAMKWLSKNKGGAGTYGAFDMDTEYYVPTVFSKRVSSDDSLNSGMTSGRRGVGGRNQHTHDSNSWERTRSSPVNQPSRKRPYLSNQENSQPSSSGVRNNNSNNVPPPESYSSSTASASAAAGPSYPKHYAGNKKSGSGSHRGASSVYAHSHGAFPPPASTALSFSPSFPAATSWSQQPLPAQQYGYSSYAAYSEPEFAQSLAFYGYPTQPNSHGGYWK